MYNLSISGVRLDDPFLKFGLHAYNSTIDIAAKVNAAHPAMEQYRTPTNYIFTELGANSPKTQEELEKLIGFADSLGIRVCLHEAKFTVDNSFVLTFDQLRELSLAFR